MLNNIISIGAKTLSKLSQSLNLGHGSTWPGHIALSLNQHIVSHILKDSPTEVILIVGTNGKTTTGKILTTILKTAEKTVIQNTSGANLLNGLASSLLLNTNIKGESTADFAVFEVDENNLPIVLQHLTPRIIIALDLFRDQLDRYGELDSIAKKWNASFQKLSPQTTLILNGDDPLIAYLAKNVSAKVVYFGLSDKEKGQSSLEHASDSLYCPNCGSKLSYKKIFYSHLGIWGCPHCLRKRPMPNLSESAFPLPGIYNQYNTLAAVLAAQQLNVSQITIDESLKIVQPAFGRQEKLTYKGKSVQVFLSKNPVSMNESLQTIKDLGAKHVLFVLNDRIPDGRDVSWIWDIDVENFKNTFNRAIVSGDRTYDMAIRLEYAEYKNVDAEPDLALALDDALEKTPEKETLYVLPTYSAMLEVRKILTGKRIL